MMKLWRRVALIVLVAVSAVTVSFYAYGHHVTFENTAQEGLPTLMELGTEWCPPCRQMQPVLRNLRDKYEGRINIQSHDLNDPTNYPLGSEHQVKVTPTLVYLDAQGNVVKRFEGFRAETLLELDFRELGWIV